MRRPILLIAAAIILVLGALFLRGNSANDEVKYDKPENVVVRPDVEKYIRNKYSKSKKTQAAVMELARQFQIAIAFPELALKIHKDLDKADSCFEAIFGDNYKEGLELEGIVVNTKARSLAYIKYNAKLSGGTYVAGKPSLSDCTPSVNSIEN